MNLNDSVKFIKGVGPDREKVLNRLGIFTIKDLITFYPRQYEDRSNKTLISKCVKGQNVLIEGTVISKLVNTRISNGRTMQKLMVEDETGKVSMIWFNQPFLKNKFEIGQKYRFYGKFDYQYGKVCISSPVFDDINNMNNTGKIVPIYSLTHNLTQNVLRKIIENAIDVIDKHDCFEEKLPQYIIDNYKLDSSREANINIHFPLNSEKFKSARKRLVFEELLSTQMALLQIKNNNLSDQTGIEFNKNVHIDDVIKTLSFDLTNAQKRVLDEINKDMESDKIMNRLLQGDVGSGKTIVSIISAYKAVKSGYQVAILVPTSILAEQHLNSFKSILDKFEIKCEILTSSVTKKKREKILINLKNGQIDILIGTHAILEENVEFNNLGLIVTDEQHRFGVNQRTKIIKKGINPDVLVMSATPIPRTLALILYGDLDISIIDELPPDRKAIKTYAVNEKMEDRVNAFVQKQIAEGRQCYIVCPLVEDNEDKSELISVKKVYEKYKQDYFSGYNVAYLHGKMKQKEKDEVMNKFKSGEIDVLVATTVIEVGVDVPNASIMIIENAQRFGLAQLHQLRGRVGRGKYESYCILKCQGEDEKCNKRMDIMCKTNDGFKISQMDLELRGSGEFFGTKQHGIPEFKIANLFTDIDILKQTQQVAIKIINGDPKLKKEENQILKDLIKDKFTERIQI